MTLVTLNHRHGTSHPRTIYKYHAQGLQTNQSKRGEKPPVNYSFGGSRGHAATTWDAPKKAQSGRRWLSAVV